MLISHVVFGSVAIWMQGGHLQLVNQPSKAPIPIPRPDGSTCVCVVFYQPGRDGQIRTSPTTCSGFHWTLALPSVPANVVTRCGRPDVAAAI